jgi:uncharacterized protein YndB with AHSA1/START domain
MFYVNIKSMPKIDLEIEINCGLDELWQAWTTEQGIKSFFAPDCDLELKIEGKYEIFFDLDAPYGLKGSEGMRILAVQEKRMLAFTWNAPPSIPIIRAQRTHVVLYFEAITQEHSKLRLINDGYGDSEDWLKALAYFENAWGKIVLPRLKQYLEKRSV